MEKVTVAESFALRQGQVRLLLFVSSAAKCQTNETLIHYNGERQNSHIKYFHSIH